MPTTVANYLFLLGKPMMSDGARRWIPRSRLSAILLRSVIPPQMPNCSHVREWSRHSVFTEHWEQISMACRIVSMFSFWIGNSGNHQSRGRPLQAASFIQSKSIFSSFTIFLQVSADLIGDISSTDEQAGNRNQEYYEHMSSPASCQVLCVVVLDAVVDREIPSSASGAFGCFHVVPMVDTGIVCDQ